MSNSLFSLSDKISSLVASSATFVCAIRTAADRHITGVLIQGDTIIAVNNQLPSLDFYTAFFASGTVVSSRHVSRDPVSDLAILSIENASQIKPLTGYLPPVGSLALIVAADFTGAPTARLALVHRLAQTAHGLTPILDAPSGLIEPGAAILDPEGRLIGLAATTQGSDVMAIPAASVIRLAGRAEPAPSTVPEVKAACAPRPVTPQGRAWLGLSLQPITVPDHLITKAGQPSARMVMNVISGGPADRAGLKVGDVVLTLNGNSTSGANGLRAFLSAERIGSAMEMRLLRDGVLMTTTLVIGSQPG